MKRFLLSTGYVVSLLVSTSVLGRESPDLTAAVKADSRRALEITRKAVLEDLARRIPQLARENLAVARPRPEVLPGALVAERRLPGGPLAGRGR